MKFYYFIFTTLTLTGLLLSSCSKTNDKNFIETENNISQETFDDGLILSKTASLCLFGRDSKMHPVIKLYTGDDISVLKIDGIIDTKFIPENDGNNNFTNIEKQTNDSLNLIKNDSLPEQDQNLKGTEYVHIVHDNLDFWLEKSVFALNCENAVTIEKTYLYTNDSLSEKIDSPLNPLKFASKIARAKENTSADSPESASPKLGSESPKSVKIFFYDSSLKSIQEAFVSSASISTRIDDIVVSQVAEELKITKRAVPRNELFAKAAKYNPCQKVLAALNAQKTETKTYSYQEVLKSMQKMPFGVNVDELMTVDQSKDPFK
ncbi:hypothetical protein [Treponema sp.]|uniref:hypothetical protein n=1 Tax=Treponema sp. TaxID=166 RepID=UPI00388ED4CE